jgi:tetratricopeptide (TPR) repeat protein
MKIQAFLSRMLALLALLLISLPALAAESAPTVTNAQRTEETNSQEMLRTYLQLQEQLHATQLAIDQNRQEARAAAEQTALALADRLKAIEESLRTQRARELEAMQSSNRIMFVVGVTFAAIGFLAVLCMAYFQWRAVNRLAEISAALPALRGLGLGHALAPLQPSHTPLLSAGPAEQSSQRLLGALDRLEKRIYQLEHIRPADEAAGENGKTLPSNGNGGALTNANSGSSGTGADTAAASTADARINLLLGKGQTMLSLDQPEAALACFDEVLALNPKHPEALVKKGAALERLQKLKEAIECYDRAIAADSSMTIAYLHKGGLFNRLERFSEALQCYELALRTQEKSG